MERTQQFQKPPCQNRKKEKWGQPYLSPRDLELNQLPLGIMGTTQALRVLALCIASIPLQ